MPKLRINGINYFYEVKGQGRPLLLLHGFTGNLQNWQPLMPNLTSNYQIITVDLLGHGRSDSPAEENRYSSDNAGADLLAMMDVLEVDKVGLLGYSMGGRLALCMAAAFPERINSLILESASPGYRSEKEQRERVEQDRALADWIEMKGMEAFVARWEKLPLWASQKKMPWEARKELQQQRLQNNPKGLANSLRGMGAGTQPPQWKNLPHLPMPVLLLTGQLDQKFTGINQEMAALIPTVYLDIVPQAGHNVHLERPAYFLKLVHRFLSIQNESRSGTP